MSLTACSLNPEAQVIYVTATYVETSAQMEVSQGIITPTLILTPPTVEANRTPDPTSTSVVISTGTHTVVAGETLTGIAVQYNTTVEQLMALNGIENPNILTVGQVLQIPPPPDQETPPLMILADAQLIRDLDASQFDIAGFIAAQPGYIRVAIDRVITRQADGSGLNEFLSSAQVVERVSKEFSVDPRVLLALLEYRAGWLSNPDPDDLLKTNPMISKENSERIDRDGLYRQLAWTANELNRGYYGWKYDGWSVLEFDTGERLTFARGLNAASVGVQHFLHLKNDYARWGYDVSENGFYLTYQRYFGSPTADLSDPLAGIGTQPELTLPFESGDTWFFTGGAHGGWGNGSAWGAVDFAPPDERTSIACYTSDYWVTAVASGSIVRSGGGVVVLDLDQDGHEATGWTILYLHVASDGRIGTGGIVQAGDRIGRAACEGGFSTATHLHIGRRYNGEWLPANCYVCRVQVPTFTMDGWKVIGLRGQEYQGYLERNGDRRVAEQGRTAPNNRISR
ncbi:MAG: LysM peptidoglycan-binding domain-containing M23 family metallopeptidase [Anaerolineae bacterium]|nr:LysM peptidoglycan-binding domain-containing M23 family metallopeptidase [Anaerolineae bacterium]